MQQARLVHEHARHRFEDSQILRLSTIGQLLVWGISNVEVAWVLDDDSVCNSIWYICSKETHTPQLQSNISRTQTRCTNKHVNCVRLLTSNYLNYLYTPKMITQIPL